MRRSLLAALAIFTAPIAAFAAEDQGAAMAQAPALASAHEVPGSGPNVGGTRRGPPVAPAAVPLAPPVEAVAPAASAPPKPVAHAAAHAKHATPAAVAASRPAAAHHQAAKAAPAAPQVATSAGSVRIATPLRIKPALESPGRQVLGAGAPLRLVTQLENDAGVWWYVETESGTNGWLRDSDITH